MIWLVTVVGGVRSRRRRAPAAAIAGWTRRAGGAGTARTTSTPSRMAATTGTARARVPSPRRCMASGGRTGRRRRRARRAASCRRSWRRGRWKPRPVVWPWLYGADVDHEPRAAEAGQRAGDGDGDVLHPVHGTPSDSAAARVLADRAQPQPERRVPQHVAARAGPAGGEHRRAGEVGGEPVAGSPATSETKNQRFSSSQPSGSGSSSRRIAAGDERHGEVPDRAGHRGRLVMVPSPWPTKISLDRNRVTPGARMLMATPDTMWSTPKVTVARAWSRPPSAPPRRRRRSAAHGPQCQPAQPANHVPRIIIPSRPMLTMPARSRQRPPRPASRIGAAAPTAAMNVAPR